MNKHLAKEWNPFLEETAQRNQTEKLAILLL